MINWLKISLMTLSLATLSAVACDEHGKSGFMPENNMYIPVGLKGVGGITEIQFNRVMDKITSLYSSAVEKSGKKFVIERKWTDGTVNAYAHQNTPGTDTIVMFGGLARHQETTEDAMALVACHELGHHIGGAPKKVTGTIFSSPSWASNEGQSDYWGVMKCLRHYFEKDDNRTAINTMTIPADVFTKCQSVYKNTDEVAICARSAMAGLALARLLAAIASDKSTLNFTTPDTTVVQTTFDAHPKAQCRLDTFLQGTLCDHDFSEQVSNSDANTGVCSLRNGDKIGNRPLCWFKP